jgi:hypothetical protein
VATALLVGSDDAALVATLAEVLAGVGASLAQEQAPGGEADLVLLLLGDRLDLGPWLALHAASALHIPVIVLMRFYDASLAAQARACGALACHGLDQPVAGLTAALAEIV